MGAPSNSRSEPYLDPTELAPSGFDSRWRYQFLITGGRLHPETDLPPTTPYLRFARVAGVAEMKAKVLNFLKVAEKCAQPA
jgi:hypothetical protein